MIILGIETSCDETGIAIYDSSKGLISECVYSQINIHKIYGGIIPEIASRSHMKILLPLVLLTLKKFNCLLNQLDCVAYTVRPGLIGSLFIGTSFSKSLAYSLGVPVIGINHLMAHMLVSIFFSVNLCFPCIGLLVSGAHTMLVKILDCSSYKILGETLDDSAGEIFDKVSRTLDLDSPNGVSIEKISEKKFKYVDCFFPTPLKNNNCLDFSFSGLKTFVIKYFKFNKLTDDDFINIVYNFQIAVIKTISAKCKIVFKNTHVKNLVLSGGVCSNKQLRRELFNVVNPLNVKIHVSPIKYCTDNGVMIAFSGYIKMKNFKYDKYKFIESFSKSDIK